MGRYIFDSILFMTQLRYIVHEPQWKMFTVVSNSSFQEGEMQYKERREMPETVCRSIAELMGERLARSIKTITNRPL